MNIDLRDKVVVVTGSSKGIGKELIKAFAKEDSQIVINYFQSEEAANQLYNQIIKHNKKCIRIKADVCPGFIVTDLNRHNDEKRKIAMEKSLMSIDNSLHDLLNFILFLSSDRLLGVSGQVFNIDSRCK